MLRRIALSLRRPMAEPGVDFYRVAALASTPSSPLFRPPSPVYVVMRQQGRPHPMRRFWLAAIWLALALPPAARADDVTDQIDQAVAAYRKGDLTTAVAALDAAAGLIRDKKSQAWKAVLPEPLEGWTGDPPEAQALPPALLGGGTTVSRKYRKSGDTVTVTVMADAPLVQALAG